MIFQRWLAQAIARLSDSESPRRDAEILLGHVTGRARTWLLAFGETALTDDQLAELEALLSRRQRGEPIAHLVGQREFWSLPLLVSPATLIPRPDTECLVEQALARLPATPCRILDLGTGTGAIALALASERPDCRVTAVDFMPDAAVLAARNAAQLGITNVTVLQSNWFSALAGQQFEIIVSNPPYIDETDPHLAQGDVRFEPKTALVAADNGLADLAHIVREGRRFLTPDGLMLLEHGWQQGAAVRELFHDAGYLDVVTCRDYGDNDRLTLGRFPAMERKVGV
ncbi:peptide chain release factor N(5)-glutamine methyltransferase [Klebsiella sp. WOUb02]|uniref:peptide chain release factor N(5)-glutamine methyltransferase n=1 Tax=Klebsiella sp. WOUb02 TaxID=3161071 RepID=UPI003CF5E92E